MRDVKVLKWEPKRKLAVGSDQEEMILRACSFLTLEFGERASVEGSFLSIAICERTLSCILP